MVDASNSVNGVYGNEEMKKKKKKKSIESVYLHVEYSAEAVDVSKSFESKRV